MNENAAAGARAAAMIDEKAAARAPAAALPVQNAAAHARAAAFSSGNADAGATAAAGIEQNAAAGAATDNPWFPAPVPSLAKVQAVIDALDKAQAATSKTKGLPAARNDALKKLRDLLTRLKGYVQAVANDNPSFAESIITSASMDIVQRPAPRIAILTVYPGPVSGSVRLVARAVAKEASYWWQLSADGGKTWVAVRRTQQANTVVKDLQPGTKYAFRFQAVTRRLTTNWCDPVFYVVQ